MGPALPGRQPEPHVIGRDPSAVSAGEFVNPGRGHAMPPDTKTIVATGARTLSEKENTRRADLVTVTKTRLEQLNRAQRDLSALVEVVVWAREAEVKAIKALMELNDLRPEGELRWSHQQWDDLNRALGEFRRPPQRARALDGSEELRRCFEDYASALVRAREQVDEMEGGSADREDLARKVHRVLNDLQILCRDIGDLNADRSTALAGQVHQMVSEILHELEPPADLTTHLRPERPLGEAMTRSGRATDAMRANPLETEDLGGDVMSAGRSGTGR